MRITNLSFVVLLSLTCCTLDQKDRKTNYLEGSYMHLAIHLRSTVLCDKISPRAYISAGLAPPGDQIYYSQSKCYYELAYVTGNPDYCSKVVEKKAFFLKGHRISEKSCRKARADTDKSLIVGGDLDLILRLIGYSPADLRRANATDDSDLADLVYSNKLQEDIKKRAELLPDFSKSPPMRFADYLQLSNCANKEPLLRHCRFARCLNLEIEGAINSCLEDALP